MTRHRKIPQRNASSGDQGSVLLLALGGVVVCALALIVLVDISAAFLQRQQLFATADAAALAGAQAIDLDAYYRDGAGEATRLDAAAVESIVRRHLAHATREVPGMTVDTVWSDATRVTVGLRAPLRLPFLAAAFPADVVAESSARLDYRAGA